MDLDQGHCQGCNFFDASFFSFDSHRSVCSLLYSRPGVIDYSDRFGGHNPGARLFYLSYSLPRRSSYLNICYCLTDVFFSLLFERLFFFAFFLLECSHRPCSFDLYLLFCFHSTKHPHIGLNPHHHLHQRGVDLLSFAKRA